MSDFALRVSFDRDKILDFHGPADITKEATEAIVNAANSYLLGGGGVDGAIHRAGGPSILKECAKIAAEIGQLPAGKAVLTTGGRLPAKYVIHTVGPVYRSAAASRPQKRWPVAIANPFVSPTIMAFSPSPSHRSPPAPSVTQCTRPPKSLCQPQ